MTKNADRRTDVISALYSRCQSLIVNKRPASLNKSDFCLGLIGCVDCSDFKMQSVKGKSTQKKMWKTRTEYASAEEEYSSSVCDEVLAPKKMKPDRVCPSNMLKLNNGQTHA